MSAKLQWLGLMILLLQSQPSLAQEKSKSLNISGNARDLYIGCSLYLRDNEVKPVLDGQYPTYSSITCATTAFNAMGYSKAIKPRSDWDYCIPKDASTSASPIRAIIGTYVNFYEKYGVGDRDMQGLTMMLYSLKSTWPCEKAD